MSHNNIMFIFSVILFFPLSNNTTAISAEEIGINTIEDRIIQVTYFSEVFNKSRTYCIIFPEGYALSSHDWPVVFLLHGRGRHDRSLIDDASTKAALLQSSFITVLPSGDDGWYIDSPFRKEERYEAALLETIDDVENRYRISDNITQRGISGWSMGGYGCVRFAEEHKMEFGAVASMIGLLDFPRNGLPRGQDYTVPLDRFTRDQKIWRQFNPIHHADALEGKNVLLITADSAFDLTMNRNFARRLDAVDIPYTIHTLSGGHTFQTVQRSVPIVVDFFNVYFDQEPHSPDPALGPVEVQPEN